MVQIQFSLIKKIKTGRPEHSLTLHSSMSANISYTLPPPTPHPPQSGRNMRITPESTWTVFNLSTYILSISGFNLPKFDLMLD